MSDAKEQIKAKPEEPCKLIEPGLPADFDREAFARRKDHRWHAPGVPQSPAWSYYRSLPGSETARYGLFPYRGKMDMAWTVMLYRQGLISHETAVKLLQVLPETQNQQGDWTGEVWLMKRLNGDETTASAVNYGRTQQEPMYRMAMRDALIDVFEEAFGTLGTLLDQAEVYADAMMAGQSHFSHAQPTTYGAYLLTVHDGLARGLEQLELAYRRTNENSGGCGACSGTGWPVDRDLITDLLGFDKTIEVTFDCEGSQDQMPQIMFALSSMALTLTRTGMDHSIWTLEEINQVHTAPEWCGVSSFMPQKAHGGMFENVRIAADEVLGEMMKLVIRYKGEAIQDVLPVFTAPGQVFNGVNQIRKGLGFLRCLVATIKVNRKRMLEIVKNGYSGAPDLAIVLIRNRGFAGRQAHRVCATCVRLARERGIKPYEMTGALLDEAARFTSDPEPGLTNEQVQECMGLDHFFEKHNGQGDPTPDETRRLVTLRRDRLKELQISQEQRRRHLSEADQRLKKAMCEILEETPK